MKKFFTTCIGILVVMTNLYAAKFYVDGTKAGDTGDGKSWANAKKTISAAGTASAAGDSIFVKAGIYTYTQATAGSSCFATVAERNYFGGFAGSENLPSERPKSDLDNNGIVDPWEFTNATTLNLTATNNAYGLYLNSNTTSQKVFDGFTISGSSSEISITGTATTYANSFIKMNNFSLFQNNIITNVTYTVAVSTSGNLGGSVQGGVLGVLGQAGTVHNCLVANNNVAITATGMQYDTSISPLIFITSSGTTGRNVCSNTIIRNNQVNFDCSGVTSMTNNNQRGMILALTSSNNASYSNAVKNILIHNNSVLFTPKTGSAANTNLGNGGLLYVYNPSTTGYQDSILNCTVANNKMTRIGYAIRVGFSATTQYAHIVANNVAYNNYNYKDDGSYVIQNFVCWNTGTNIANKIANNITNGGSSITAVTDVTLNNLSDLANTNTGTKAPYFTNPTTTIGYTSDGSVETSRWSIASGSYLAEKGLVTTNKYDFAGLLFAANPAVGAYEYVFNPGTKLINAGNIDLVTVTRNSLQSNFKGLLQVLTFSGQTVCETAIQEGDRISLVSGAYIIRLKTQKDTFVQKVVL